MTNTTPRSASAGRIAMIAGGIGVPVAGLAVAAVSILPMITQTSTTIEGLAVTSETTHFVGNGSRWVVPADIDWSSFPQMPPQAFEDDTSCTEDQLSWLAAHGTENQGPIEYGFINSATAGANLSIYDIRLEGSLTEAVPSVAVDCVNTVGFGGVQMVIAELEAGTEASAVVSPETDSIEGSDVTFTPGDQVVFNLRPGDSSTLLLELGPSRAGFDFRGSVMASFSSGDKTTRMALSTPMGHEFSIAAPSIPDAQIIVEGGVMSCLIGGWTGDRSTARHCDATEVMRRLVDGWDSVDSNGIVGTWSGAVLGDRHPYSVTVTIAEDRDGYSAIAAYPELPCSATWRETGRSAGGATFLEKVTSGRCFDDVPVTITVSSDGTLGYSALSGGLTITSTLTRTG